MSETSRIAGRTALMVVGALALGALAGGAVAVRVARDVVTPPRRRVMDVPILAVDRDRHTVTLGRTVETEVPGRYTLRFDADRGAARVTDILAMDDQTVVRRLEAVERGDLERASAGRWSAWWYNTPADLDVPYREVGIDTPVGVAPAWRVEPQVSSPNTPWMIAVHGRGVTRAEALRAVPPFRSAGFRCLLVSYRNDGDAPASHDGRYALGGEEWRDVEAAIAYAREEGARRVVLMGWSMGGATVLQCILHSKHGDSIAGVVLESPVVDWVSVLRHQAAAAGLPPRVRDAALALLASPRASSLVGLQSPIDFERLDMVARAAEIPIPILVLHSDDDGTVPSDGSVALAAIRPDLVRLERFTRARHTRLWNYDPVRWERAIRAWLDELGLSVADGSPISAVPTNVQTERPIRPSEAASTSAP